MHQRIAQALLKNVYYPITAVVSINSREKITSVYLFDTKWSEPQICPQADRIVLISSHPEGCSTPYDEDIAHISQIAGMASKPLCVYIFNEDTGCKAVDLSQS